MKLSGNWVLQKISKSLSLKYNIGTKKLSLPRVAFEVVAEWGGLYFIYPGILQQDID